MFSCKVTSKNQIWLSRKKKLFYVGLVAMHAGNNLMIEPDAIKSLASSRLLCYLPNILI